LASALPGCDKTPCDNVAVGQHCRNNGLQCGNVPTRHIDGCGNDVYEMASCGDCPTGQMCNVFNKCVPATEPSDMAVTPLPSDRKVATVQASTYQAGGAVAGGGILVTFNDFKDPPGKMCGKQSATAACNVTTCSGGTGQTMVTGSDQGQGTVEILGKKFTWAWEGSSKRYEVTPPPAPNQPLFAGGDMIIFTAPGQQPITIAAASPQTLVTPTAPPIGTGTLQIARDSDFKLEWAGGGAGNVAVTVAGSNANDVVSLDCIVPANALLFSLPKELVQRIAPGPGSWSLRVENTVTADINGYSTVIGTRNSFAQGNTVVVGGDVQFK
jgi:hypothetical protein